MAANKVKTKRISKKERTEQLNEGISDGGTFTNLSFEEARLSFLHNNEYGKDLNDDEINEQCWFKYNVAIVSSIVLFFDVLLQGNIAEVKHLRHVFMKQEYIEKFM